MPKRSREMLVAIGLLALLAVPWAGALAGEPDDPNEATVTFRLTLEGPIQDDDGFVIDVRCDGGDFCNGLDDSRFVYFCAHPMVVDTVRCDQDPLEFTVDMPPQVIGYELIRKPNVDEDGLAADSVLSGSVVIHDGTQVISLTYIYPAGPRALPNTALPNP
jgi:hypothetical protein